MRKKVGIKFISSSPSFPLADYQCPPRPSGWSRRRTMKTCRHHFLFLFIFLTCLTPKSIKPGLALNLEKTLSSRIVITKYGSIRGIIVTLSNPNLQPVEIFMGKTVFPLPLFNYLKLAINLSCLPLMTTTLRKHTVVIRFQIDVNKCFGVLTRLQFESEQCIRKDYNVASPVYCETINEKQLIFLFSSFLFPSSCASFLPLLSLPSNFFRVNCQEH